MWAAGKVYVGATGRIQVGAAGKEEADATRRGGVLQVKSRWGAAVQVEVGCCRSSRGGGAGRVEVRPSRGGVLQTDLFEFLGLPLRAVRRLQRRFDRQPKSPIRTQQRRKVHQSTPSAVQGVGEPRDTALWLQRWRKASEERWVKLMSKSVYSFAVGRPCQMQRQGGGEAAAEVCRGGVEGHQHQFRDWLALSRPRR